MSTPADIAVIDYGLCNVQSVCNALKLLGASPALIVEPKEVDWDSIYGVILPGVGSFGDAMKNLRAAGWTEKIPEIVFNRKLPLLGICLGMQLLATKSYEHGEHAGLGVVAGVVNKLDPSQPNIRIPHVGWNDVKLSLSSQLFSGLGEQQTFYFVHSYVLTPTDESIVAATCDYGFPFIAALESKNIFATQFHPEKSQRAGLAVLRNFYSIAKLGHPATDARIE